MGVDNYVVLYVPDDDSMTVTVQHFFYGGADIESRLKDESWSAGSIPSPFGILSGWFIKEDDKTLREIPE